MLTARTVPVLAGEKILIAEIADNALTRARGLSGRKTLPKDNAMLFQFQVADRHGFWMKNMRFPVDIIWLRDDVIVDFKTDVQPPSKNEPLQIYYPQASANFVLETNAGFVQSSGLKTGGKIEFLDVQVFGKKRLRAQY
jgi:uncharacterized membrane protein (UPF0127 family)